MNNVVNTEHSQLINRIQNILNYWTLYTSPVLINILGNIFPCCPSVGALWRINYFNIDIQEGQCCNCDSSWDIRWNIAWALGKSIGLCPRDFLRAQAIYHCISLLSSQYRFSTEQCIAVKYTTVQYNKAVYRALLMYSMVQNSAEQTCEQRHLGFCGPADKWANTPCREATV